MAEQYWIGGFFIDLSRNQITQNEQSQTLAPKALAVLTHLAENRGKVVSQEALLAKVWPDTIVSPNTLQRSIAQLRKALGDDGKVQVYIKTHAKQGYSLECDVRWQDYAAPTNPLIPETNEDSAEKNTNDTSPSELPANETKVSLESPIQESHIKAHDTISNTDKVHMPHANQATADNNGQTATSVNQSTRSSVKLIAFFITVMLLTFIGYWYVTPKQTLPFSIVELRDLTATDNKEVAGIYSPDGQYIVFHRFSNEFCQSNIWAKNIETQQEFQLTKNLDTYGGHTFSKDGKTLIFIQSQACNEPVTQKKCYHLMSLNFDEALTAPQTPKRLLECKNSIIRQPKWLKNNNIALFQKFTNRWSLISYSIDDNKSTTLYSPNDGNLFDYDYSIEDDQFAIFRIKDDGQYYIEMLESNGQLISSHRIDYPDEIARFKAIYPNFSPLENLMTFSTGRQLFTLSYTGEITNISLPIDEPIGSPVFHPNGKRMLVIKGHYDSDIATVSLSDVALSSAPLPNRPLSKTTRQADSLTAEQKSYSVIERSTVGEESAVFQPNGDLIAFVSERSGDEQVWLSDSNGLQQLSNFPMDTNLREISWAADGQSLLANVDGELIQLFLDGREKAHPFAHSVDVLFQWDSTQQSALTIMRIKGILTFAELNLATAEIHLINDKRVNWAAKSSNGQVIYTDHLDRFWQPGPVEDKLIDVLNDQGSGKHFVIDNNTLYGINEKLELWSYSLTEQNFNIIGNMPSNIDYITDAKQSQLLITLHVSSKKEVSELILAD